MRFLQGVERELALFLGDASEQRGRMPGVMGRDQRAAVHQMAEQYGLATKGTDTNTGGRCVFRLLLDVLLCSLPPRCIKLQLTPLPKIHMHTGTWSF